MDWRRWIRCVTTTTLGLKILLLSVSLIPAFVIGMSVLVLMSAILISANEVVHVHVWLANTGAILTRREGYTLTGGGGRWG